LDEWIDPFTLLHPSSFTLHTTPSLMVPFGSIWFIFQTDPFHFSISFNFSDSIHETTNTCMKPVWKTILTKSKLVLFVSLGDEVKHHPIQINFLTKMTKLQEKFISCENSVFAVGCSFLMWELCFVLLENVYLFHISCLISHRFWFIWTCLLCLTTIFNQSILQSHHISNNFMVRDFSCLHLMVFGFIYTDIGLDESPDVKRVRKF
jgi:hypothetical protein